MAHKLILRTAENPTGAPLEDLLDQLVTEVGLRLPAIQHICHPTAEVHRKCNDEIMKMFQLCAKIQRFAEEQSVSNPIPATQPTHIH